MQPDPDSRVFEYTEVRCPHVIELSDYWSSLRVGERLPLVSDFDLIAYPQHMPWISISDIIDQGTDFRYRLVGTQVAKIFGVDLTGAALSEGDHPGVESRIALIYKYVMATGGPVWGEGRVGTVDGRDGFNSEACLLPLVNEAGEWKQIIHMLRLEDDEGGWRV